MKIDQNLSSFEKFLKNDDFSSEQILYHIFDLLLHILLIQIEPLHLLSNFINFSNLKLPPLFRKTKM